MKVYLENVAPEVYRTSSIRGKMSYAVGTTETLHLQMIKGVKKWFELRTCPKLSDPLEQYAA